MPTKPALPGGCVACFAVDAVVPPPPPQPASSARTTSAMSLRAIPLKVPRQPPDHAESVPSAATGQIQSVYLARIFRQHGNELRDVVRGSTETHTLLRDRIVGITGATILVDLVCALLALLFEHDAKGTQVTSFGSALFWSTTQILTVSSSFQNPITSAGQILDVFMEIWAMIVVAGATG